MANVQDALQQIKTTRGQLPPKSVCVIPASKANCTYDQLLFELYSAQEYQQLSLANDATMAPKYRLEDWALSVKRDEEHDQPILKRDRVLELARSLGPLFGSSPEESLYSWSLAMTPAKEAVLIQQCLNGIGQISAISSVDKTVVEKEGTRRGKPILIHSYFFPAAISGATEYLDSLGKLPLIRRFTNKKGYSYAYCGLTNEEDFTGIQTHIITVQKELSTKDFIGLIENLDERDVDEEKLDQLCREAGLSSDADEEMRLYDTNTSFTLTEEPLNNSDKPQLQFLVYALATLHLSSVRVDLFNALESDNFLIFPNYLSFMWYDFATKLTSLKVGYCAQCGQGFSLVGHRGIKKRFCSDACKTIEKNKRSAKERDEVRRLFIEEGLTVAEIADRVYPNERANNNGRKRTISLLRNSRELKRMLENSQDRDLIVHCFNEGVLTEEEGRRVLKVNERRKGLE